MDFPRIAVVGAGNLSSRRIYPYLGAAGATLVGVCDLDPRKAERNAALFGGKPYTDMEKMLDELRPDGVIICIGPEAHARLAPVVMRRGIPVYTEKPPATTAAEALAVARVSRQTGVLCTTAFKKRYNVAYNRAREFIAEFPPEDLYLDFAIHAIDLSGYLFGDAAEVFAYAKEQDAYSVAIRYSNGAVGSLNLNCGRSFLIPTEEVEIPQLLVLEDRPRGQAHRVARTTDLHLRRRQRPRDRPPGRTTGFRPSHPRGQDDHPLLHLRVPQNHGPLRGDRRVGPRRPPRGRSLQRTLSHLEARRERAEIPLRAQQPHVPAAEALADESHRNAPRHLAPAITLEERDGAPPLRPRQTRSQSAKNEILLEQPAEPLSRSQQAFERPQPPGAMGHQEQTMLGMESFQVATSAAAPDLHLPATEDEGSREEVLSQGLVGELPLLDDRQERRDQAPS